MAKGGKISTIVPFCSHIDHSEHLYPGGDHRTGVADLRGVGPMERARRIINHCAHLAYRDYLHHYVESSRPDTCAMTWAAALNSIGICWRMEQCCLNLDLKSFTNARSTKETRIMEPIQLK